MGFGPALVFATIVLCVGAAVAGLVLAWLVELLTQGCGAAGFRLQRAARVLPLLAVPYILACGVLYASWCERHGMDVGLGDEWRVPLPHGYSMLMVDEPGEAFVRDASNRHVLGGVDELQVAGDYLLASGHGLVMRDLRTGEQREAASMQELTQLAAAQGITVELRPPRELYAKRRSPEADEAFGWFVLLGPAALLLVLAVRVVQVRRDATRAT